MLPFLLVFFFFFYSFQILTGVSDVLYCNDNLKVFLYSHMTSFLFEVILGNSSTNFRLVRIAVVAFCPSVLQTLLLLQRCCGEESRHETALDFSSYKIV